MEALLVMLIRRYGPIDHQDMWKFYETVLEREALHYETFPLHSHTQYPNVLLLSSMCI